MPFEVDEDKLKDAKLVEMTKLPLKETPKKEFPKAVYLHPKDKTKTHKAKLVQNPAELEDALKAGYKKQPHVPVAPEPEKDPDYEYEAPKPEQTSDAPVALESLTKPELVALAKLEFDLELDVNQKKDDLIATIREERTRSNS